MEIFEIRAVREEHEFDVRFHLRHQFAFRAQLLEQLRLARDIERCADHGDDLAGMVFHGNELRIPPLRLACGRRATAAKRGGRAVQRAPESSRRGVIVVAFPEAEPVRARQLHGRRRFHQRRAVVVDAQHVPLQVEQLDAITARIEKRTGERRGCRLSRFLRGEALARRDHRDGAHRRADGDLHAERRARRPAQGHLQCDARRTRADPRGDADSETERANRAAVRPCVEQQREEVLVLARRVFAVPTQRTAPFQREARRHIRTRLNARAMRGVGAKAAP